MSYSRKNYAVGGGGPSPGSATDFKHIFTLVSLNCGGSLHEKLSMPLARSTRVAKRRTAAIQQEGLKVFLFVYRILTEEGLSVPVIYPGLERRGKSIVLFFIFNGEKYL